ncbi:hypothetical protein DFS34DRAFT_144474 [Phlyctochytrium arcticum]|nr:hypothetical protein DFS34DRAFT_144474 [Phlyctochytrium arcticum]
MGETVALAGVLELLVKKRPGQAAPRLCASSPKNLACQIEQFAKRTYNQAMSGPDIESKGDGEPIKVAKTKKRKSKDRSDSVPQETESTVVDTTHQNTDLVEGKKMKKKAKTEESHVDAGKIVIKKKERKPRTPKVVVDGETGMDAVADTEEAVPKKKERKPRTPKAELADGTDGTAEQTPEDTTASGEAAVKSKRKRKPKKGDRKPRTKAKLTDVQKLKLREKQREKQLLVESVVINKPSMPEAVAPKPTESAEDEEQPDVAPSRPAPTPSSGPGEAKRRQAAIDYLQLFVNDKPNWKFQKVKQVWILRNMWYPHQIAESTLPLALEYIKGLSHKAREETMEEAKAILLLVDPKATEARKGVQIGNKVKFEESDDEEDSEEEEDEAEEGEDSSTTEDANKLVIKRAKAILNTLKSFV